MATFGDWLRSGGAKGRSLGESTIATYEKVGRLIERKKKPTDILKADLGIATKHKYVAVLRLWAAFTDDDALQEQLSGAQLQRLLKARQSKLPQAVEAFTEEEVERFLQVLSRTRGKEPKWAWPCISLQVHLGLRAGADLAGLRKDAVESAVRTHKLTLMGKRGQVHTLPAGFVNEELQELSSIRGRWKIVADLISPESKDKPDHVHRELAYQAYRQALIAVGHVAGIEASKTHRFRHWAITHFYYHVCDKDLLQTQRFARHFSILTTARYIRTAEVDLIDEQLAEAKKGR